MTTTHAIVTKVSRRRRGIAPFLEELEAALATGSPAALLFNAGGPDAQPVALDSWAVEWIQASARKPKGPAELPELLKQCLAFLAKSSADVARLRKEAPRAGTDFYALQAELMLGSAVGMALLREAQKSVDDLVAIGLVDDARMLARFQNRLRSTVRELKLSIAESNRGRDDELVEEFTDQAAPATERTMAVHVEIDESPSTVPQRASEPRAKRIPATIAPLRRRWRTAVLLVSVMSALAVWLAVQAIPTLTGGSAKVVSRADFNASAPILHIAAPPPSAYVVVDPARWSAYDEGQQRRLVEVMGGVLAVHGYWGLLVRTPDGKAVARWVEGRGSDLLHEAPALTPRDDAAHLRFDRFVPGAAPPREGAAVGEGAKRRMVAP